MKELSLPSGGGCPAFDGHVELAEVHTALSVRFQAVPLRDYRILRYGDDTMIVPVSKRMINQLRAYSLVIRGRLVELVGPPEPETPASWLAHSIPYFPSSPRGQRVRSH